MNKATFDEALSQSREYFKGDELAANVWINKYAMKDSFGNLYETSPEQMHHRIANEFYRVESNYPNPLTKEEIFDLLKEFKYIIPQGGPMAGIGNDYQVASLSNCFVIGNRNTADSYGGILKIDEEQVQLMKRRGGVGHDLSHIRPAGSSQQRTHIHRCCTVHGTLLQLYQRGSARWTSRCTDALNLDQAPGLRKFYRCQDGKRQNYRCQRLCKNRR